MSTLKDFRLGAFVTSENLQQENKEDSFAASHSECWMKGAHPLD
jgi:hypothetical protein